MIKVTMNLTERDVENTDVLQQTLKARSKAHAVSIALSLASYLVQALLRPGTELLLRFTDGTVERIVVPEIEASRAARREPVQEKWAAVA